MCRFGTFGANLVCVWGDGGGEDSSEATRYIPLHTWLFFFLRMKKKVSKNSMNLENQYHHSALAICMYKR